ncbi:MAG: hypothetical protein H6512_10350 [Acidimicrobiia bacterium]|nr:hypothetical protein [Acidimicrobiia bacterium]
MDAPRIVIAPGQPILGPVVSADGTNFGVYAPDAEKVMLCLFDSAGRNESCACPAGPGTFTTGSLPGSCPASVTAFGRTVRGRQKSACVMTPANC